MLCSLDCKRYFETEIEAPEAANAPHQLLGKNSGGAAAPASTSASPSAAARAGGKAAKGATAGKAAKGAFSSSPAAGAGNDEKNADSTSANTNTHSTSPASIAAANVAAAAAAAQASAAASASINHQLNNCALSDIRERLGQVVSATASATAANTAATNGEVALVAPAAVSSRLKVRFETLGEIPNVQLRLDQTGARLRSLLFKLISDINKFEKNILSERNGRKRGHRESPPAGLTTSSANTSGVNLFARGSGGDASSSSSTAAAASSSPSSAATTAAAAEGESKKAAAAVVDHDAAIFQHRGVSSQLTGDEISRVFLAAVGTIASAQKFDLFPLSQVLGICFVTPIIRTL